MRTIGLFSLRRAATVSAAWALALGLFATESRGDPTPSQIAAARELGRAGVAAARTGDCATAVDRLTRAEALYHAPTTAEPLGECQVKLGRIVAGTETLSKVVHEQLPSSASPLWTAAQARAKEVLDQALPRLGRLRLYVERPAGAGNPEVTVNGERMDPALLENDRPTNPGLTTIRASAPGTPRSGRSRFKTARLGAS